MSALVVQAAVIETPEPGVFDVAVTEAAYEARRQRAAKKWGLGTAITIRIEPEEEAAKWHQFKHLYGHLFEPVAGNTGETVADVAVRMKLKFMPDDGRTSLTQLNYSELKAFTESVEQDIRENDPESWDDCVAAMALSDMRAGR